MADKTNSERELATRAAVFLAERLNAAGVKTVVVRQEEARREHGKALSGEDGAEFSVADIQRLNYEWDGEEVSLKAFAQAFMPLIKNRDRTLEDVGRIAEAYIADVKADPAKYVPQLKPENMSHARYFILRDGSVFSPSHPMAASPEYETQRKLWQIYSSVLGKERMADFAALLDPSKLRSAEENARFVSMEREVSASSLMQGNLENNAEKVNAERVAAVRNLVQYFEGNPDYTASEKALILKGAMTWGVSEKKRGNGPSEVKLVKLTDANDIAVPVVGGEAAAIVEGIRKGMNFKESMQEARERNIENGQRSVPRNYTGWKVYPKSSREEDAVVLNQDASGTGWCTGSGLSTARSHLSGGDFHIYFEAGEPLIAIRTEDGRMAEPPRGAHEGQFCTDREEQIAFEYIREGHGITAGDDYIADIEGIRRIMSPEATWKDAFMLPSRRRYDNGEFGVDTKSWGEAVEKRISELLSSSREERFAAGCYTEEEWFGSDDYKEGRWEKLRGIKNRNDITISSKLYPSLEFCTGDLTCTGDSTFASLRSVGGSLKTDCDVIFTAPALKSVGGDFLPSFQAKINVPALNAVGGRIDVYEGATFQADNLQEVGEYITVFDGASFRADNLQKVGGGVEVYEGANFQADRLQEVGIIVDVLEGASFRADNLQKVGGGVDVHKGVTFQADRLQEVGGSVIVYEGANFQADNLQKVGISVDVLEGASFRADNLQEVGGNVDVDEGATFQADNLQKVGLSVIVDEGATFQADNLQKVGARIAVRKEASFQADNLQEVGGGVDVHESATFQADNLQKVGEHISVHEGATFQADRLQKVGEHISVHEGATFQADNLQKVGESVIVHKGASFQADNLQKVGARIAVRKEASFQTDNLQEVGGGVDVHGGATFQADNLQKVGGNVNVRVGASFQADNLQKVGGNVDVYEGASFRADRLQEIGGNVREYVGAVLSAPALHTIEGYLELWTAKMSTPELRTVRGDNIFISPEATLDAPLLVNRNFHLSDGTVYGYQAGDTIYLTPEGINPNTPIHEYAHLWAKAYEKTDPLGWEELKDDLKATPLWAAVEGSPEYAFLQGDEDRLAGEVLARMTGDRGEEMLMKAAGEVIEEGTPEREQLAATVGRFRDDVYWMAISNVFKYNPAVLPPRDGVTLDILLDYAQGKGLGRFGMKPDDFERIEAAEDESQERRTILADSDFDIRNNDGNFAENERPSEHTGEAASRRDPDERREDDRRGVPSDRTGAVAVEADLGDIRMLEDGMATSPGEHPVYGTGDGPSREECKKESDRLLALAKEHGLFVELADIRNENVFSIHSKESIVFRSPDGKKVIKVRDPFANARLKGHPASEAIYEHIIHNIYFPETRYDFVGITEYAGEARIVLSQPFIHSISCAPDSEARKTLVEKGLGDMDAYYLGNGDIAVTDYFGSNALLGKDGKVYVIDPVISHRSPAREIIQRYITEGKTHTIMTNEGINQTHASARKFLVTDREAGVLSSISGSLAGKKLDVNEFPSGSGELWVRVEDAEEILTLFRQRVESTIPKLDGLQLDVLESILADGQLLNGAFVEGDLIRILEEVDKKVATEVRTPEGDVRLSGILGETTSDGQYTNRLLKKLDQDKEKAMGEVLEWNRRKLRTERTLLDRISGTSFKPAYRLPDKETMRYLTEEGHLTKNGWGLSFNDMRRIYDGFAAANDLLFLDMAARAGSYFETVRPQSLDLDSFLKETVGNATDIKEQLDATGRYNGHFVIKEAGGKDRRIIIEAGKEGEILIQDCKKVHDDLMRRYGEYGYDGLFAQEEKTKIRIEGGLFELSRKQIGELAMGRSVELRNLDTGQYNEVAYSVRDNELKTTVSYENGIRERLAEKEKQKIAERQEQGFDQAYSENKGTKISNGKR